MSDTVAMSRPVRRGYGSATRPLTSELWGRDTRGQSVAMKSVGNVDPGAHDGNFAANVSVDFSRYYDRDFARLESERLWSKTWLFACREEDIASVGDRVPFDIGPLSFMIVRTAADQIKAFYNSCIHRGTKLCVKRDSADAITCPYHGWQWKLNGTLKQIPSHWDFQSVTRQNGSLNEVSVGLWGGYVFINAAKEPPPLEAALSVIPEHFAQFDSESRYTAARFRKLVPANWKLVQEAFQESYHLSAVHPQAIPFIGDTQSQYDIWSSEHGNIARMVSPAAVPGMNADASANMLEASLAFVNSIQQWRYAHIGVPEFDENYDLREQIANWHRSAQYTTFGRELNAPDSIMIDSLLYYMFPNLNVWLSESVPFVYTFRPHAEDPQLSYFEARMLLPYPTGSARPAPAEMIELDIDDSIAEKVPEFGFTGVVLDQDMEFMSRIQAGVRAADRTKHHPRLGLYQEMIVRRWQELVDRAVCDV